MKHFLLFYDVGPDFLARRAAFRDAHLAKAWAAHGRRELILAGALADPVDGSALLFAGNSADIAASFAGRPVRGEWSGDPLAGSRVDDGCRRGCRNAPWR
jgi:hypothetical protein